MQHQKEAVVIEKGTDRWKLKNGTPETVDNTRLQNINCFPHSTKKINKNSLTTEVGHFEAEGEILGNRIKEDIL